MGLSDIAGVFSRYFIVGFFLPVFFAMVALAQAVDSSMLPHVYTQSSSGARIAILGGAALAGGLLLLGLNYNVLRIFEGYPLRALDRVPVIRLIYRVPLAAQRRRFRRARKKCDDQHIDDEGPFQAAWRLGLRFPYDRAHPDSTHLLLPTSFGNALRAFEWRSFANWHLNSIGAWPHIESLLSDQEAQVLTDAKGDVAFFVNGSLVGIISAVVLGFDVLKYQSAASLWAVAIPLAVALATYRAAIGAVQRWGGVVSACIDLHRRELYEKVGLRAPADFRDERALAWNLNRTLLLGREVPNDLALPKPPPDPAENSNGGAGQDVVAPHGLQLLLLVAVWRAIRSALRGSRAF